MRNDQCPLSKHCPSYDADSCQGCNYAAYGNKSDREPKFRVGDKVLINAEMKDGDRRSYLRGNVCTIRGRVSPRVYGITEDESVLFHEDELELAVVFRDEKELYEQHAQRWAKYMEAIRMKNVGKSIFERPIDKTRLVLGIKSVVFNDPATIVLWQDGSKTVVKAHNEAFDPEKGLAMAICKKVLGNEGNYFNIFRKWLPKDYETPAKVTLTKPWRIWYREFKDGKQIGAGVYTKSYQRKNDATRIANKLFGDSEKYEFVVSMANPWKEG